MMRYVMLVWACCLLVACGEKQASESEWETTIGRVSSGIVNIQIDVPLPFDGLYNYNSEATGFVVDKERGLILTNRHVVTPGPVTARAIFLNDEELELTPVYFDPVHDFGFYRYDPSKLKHLDVHEFRLAPERAQVGREIRVIGNDAGQKISIAPGTLSRLDATAPEYGRWKYNDFNTFYIQAASGTTGGSSGSPVIAANGDVLALNAGANNHASTAYYLPLERVARALNKIQQDTQVKRGTLQAEFRQQSYAELERLGLDAETQAETRELNPDINGLLVVKSRLEIGSGETLLEVGDILLSVEGERIMTFVELESLLDQRIGERVSLEVIRQGERQSLQLPVADLHALTPHALLKHNGGTLHELSYQQARHFNKRVVGIYIADAPRGYQEVGVPRHAVIVEVNNEPVASLEEFTDILAASREGSRLQLRYYTPNEPNVLSYAVVEVDRKWFLDSYCQHDPELGYWPCENLEVNELALERPADFTAAPQSYRNEAVNIVASSVVSVHVDLPFPLHGISSAGQGRVGFGLVVDAEKGWVLVDRSTVPSSLADVKLQFFDTVEIDAKVEYLHPIHNLALVAYDPELVKSLDIKSAKLASKSPEKSEKYLQLSIDSSGLDYRETTVERVDALYLSMPHVPRYRDANIDVIFLEQYRDGMDGVLLNAQGEVAAFWASFEDQSSDQSVWRHRGIDQRYIRQLLALAESEGSLRSLEVELVQLSAFDAIEQGLSPDWLQRYQNAADFDNQFMMAAFVSSASPNRERLKRGDILLSLDGELVTNFWDFEVLSQKEALSAEILRNGQVLDVELETLAMPGQDVSEVMLWSGAFIHPPHRAVQMQRGIEGEGLWVSFYYWGSPANRYGLGALNRIVEVDGAPIKTMEDFVATVKDKQHQDSIRIAVKDIQNQPAMLTLKVDTHYWPAYSIVKTESGFEKRAF